MFLCFRFICLWQGHDERRAFAHFAFYLDIPFHAHHHMLYNGKPQPGAAGGAAAPFIHAVNALEQPRNILFRNANAGIADDDLYLLFIGGQLYFYLPALWRIVDAIGHKIHQHLLHFIPIPHAEGAVMGVLLQGKVNVLFLRIFA